MVAQPEQQREGGGDAGRRAHHTFSLRGQEALIPSTAQGLSQGLFYSQSQACAFRFLKSPNKFRNLLVSESFRPLIIRLPETFSIRRLGKKFVSYG